MAQGGTNNKINFNIENSYSSLHKQALSEQEKDALMKRESDRLMEVEVWILGTLAYFGLLKQ